MSEVVVFSTPTCDPEAVRDIARKTGQTGVPVIKIGSTWIVGFDKGRIEKELARKAL
jgi:glutaredoxin 3